MAKAIQLVYNLQAFGNTASPVSNGLTWDPTIPGLLRTDGVEVSAKLINSGEKVKKIAISCEPGEQWTFNGTTTITVGRSGIYELDDKVEIVELTYVPRVKYIYNEQKSEDKKNEGLQALSNAELKYNENLTKLINDIISKKLKDGDLTPKDVQDHNDNLEVLVKEDENFLQQKQSLLDIYAQEHSDALKIYNEGLAGIYDFDTLVEPKNIVINYIYELEQKEENSNE